MRVNFNKSGCLRVSPRCDITCADIVFTIVISFSLHAMLPLLANKDEYIVSSDGHTLPWACELRYLGVHFTDLKS